MNLFTVVESISACSQPLVAESTKHPESKAIICKMKKSAKMRVHKFYLNNKSLTSCCCYCCHPLYVDVETLQAKTKHHMVLYFGGLRPTSY